MKFLIIFIYLISATISYAIDKPDLKNLVINKELKTYEKIIFKDSSSKDINLEDYKGKLVILNFWATWCAPCREEMPSLDLLKLNVELNNLEIFPINIGDENLAKSKEFFKKLNIKNLNIYFASSSEIAKKLSIRGIPTTIFFDKEGREFARIIGIRDFNEDKFISWLNKYN